jgi:threonyl-tRNA synthetase
MEAKLGKKPSLPFWLSPTQVRFLPLNDSFTPECLRLAKAINDAGFRADVDDSGSGVGRKIAEAEKEWVPLIVVVGDKEKASGRYVPRSRKAEWLAAGGLSPDTPGTLEDLVKVCDMNTGDEPRAPLPLPMLMSQRPIFRG